MRKWVEKLNFSFGYENKGTNGKKEEKQQEIVSPDTILLPQNEEIWKGKITSAKNKLAYTSFEPKLDSSNLFLSHLCTQKRGELFPPPLLSSLFSSFLLSILSTQNITKVTKTALVQLHKKWISITKYPHLQNPTCTQYPASLLLTSFSIDPIDSQHQT